MGVVARITFRGAIGIFGMATGLCAAAGQDETRAQAKLDAAYTITFARVSVGKASLSADFKDDAYTIAATASAGGVMRILIDGEASLTANGVVRDGRLVPTSFASRMESKAGIENVRMALDDGNVRELEVTPPSRMEAPESERQGIVDPLSAMFVPARSKDDVMSQEACRRTVPVFDGRQRYDLKLVFKRMDKLSDGPGYKGPAVVCALTYVPVAGEGGSTPLVKYLSEGREIEVALAPVPEIALLAPVRLSVSSMVANLIISANRFAASMQPDPAAPPPVGPGAQ
jgi:hypothetical protein